jgi:DNA-binding PucR family transcriptional regulator
MLIGAGITVIILQKVVLYAIHHPEEIPNRLTERLRNKLSLTDEQTKKVKAILIERQKAFMALRRATRPKMERELEQLREDVASVLDKNQARKWRKRFDTLRRQWMPPQAPKDDH